MFCDQCGEENRNDRKFCTNCGSPLRDYTKPIDKKDLLMPEDVVDMQKQAKAKKRKFVVCSILSLICILASAVCIVLSSFVFQDRTVKLVLSAVAVGLAVICLILTAVNRVNSKKQ